MTIKLATWASLEGSEPCLVDENRVWPLSLLATPPRDMIDVIVNWDEFGHLLAQVKPSDAGWRPYSRDELLAPVPRPGKMLAIGLNYMDHVLETGQEVPAHQVWFGKQNSSAHGPFMAVEIPKVSQAVDYEVELVAVIGKGGRHISEESAHEHIFGYCVGNDVSARDWQLRTSQWDLGKSFDTHGPFGPWITLAQDLKDPHNLGIRCLVNDEIRQSSNTRHLCFNLWRQIAYLSQVMTLEPGDVIFTGTPGGVGLAMNPKQFLAEGDIVRCEVDQLGSIENRFVAEI